MGKPTTFRQKIWNAGNSWVVTIPADFVKHKMVDVSKEQEVTLKEVDDVDGEGS